VIAFSRVCYDAFPFVYRFGDRPITELASTIQIALLNDFTELDILIFLSLIRSELIVSDLILDHPEYNVSITSNQNINELFKLLKHKL
jgi:hypothetical protein